MTNRTGFFWDEKCFWHGGGNYAFLLPVGGLVQPLAAGALPESPESKRRLKNLLDVTGLADQLEVRSADPANHEDLARVHPTSYLAAFKELSDADGGELGQRTPFGPGGFEIATLSAGLACAAVDAVLEGQLDNAYALCRPPGHHCLPDTPMGFCLLANIAIAIERAIAARPGLRVAVVDWDVHHGNGTEAIYYRRDDVLTISLHQQHNYPLNTGSSHDRGEDLGTGCNINLPLPPGGGDAVYLAAMQKIVLPALSRFDPDLIVVACGFDASGVDPLSRMLVSSQGFAEMTQLVMQAATAICNGKLVLAHEGGYSEAHVPFCGHAVIQRLAQSSIAAPDPLTDRLKGQQPIGPLADFHLAMVDALAREFLP